MSNPKIAELLASRLGEGMSHPGNPDKGQPPTLIPLPGFRTTGLPEEQAKAYQGAAQAFGEAVVFTIETDGESEIVPKSELAQLRAAEAEPGDAVPVACQSCSEPLFWLQGKNGRLTLPATGLAALARTKHQCKTA